jgi:hypothetical protein
MRQPAFSAMSVGTREAGSDGSSPMPMLKASTKSSPDRPAIREMAGFMERFLCGVGAAFSE